MQPPVAAAAARSARKPRSGFVMLHADNHARRCARIGAKRSAKLISQMEHANLSKCPLASGTMKGDEEVLYVSLAEISESGACSEEHTAALIRQILIALDYLHSQGVVHGAIRSENIFIEANTGLIKVALDLFVSKSDENQYDDGACACSVDYPDLSLPRVDVWAVGCIARQLLTGFSPTSCCSSDFSYLNRLCEMTTVPRGLSLAAAAFLSECFSTSDDHTPASHELLDHPFVQFPLAMTALGEEEEDPAFRIDDYPLIAEEVRTHPASQRPIGVPSLKLSAPLLFTSSSQSERSKGQGWALRLGDSVHCADSARHGDGSTRERGISRILFADDCAKPQADSRKRKSPTTAAAAAAMLVAAESPAPSTALPRQAKVSAGFGRNFAPGPVCLIDPPRAA
jgi:serine/threonine protein kinase